MPERNTTITIRTMERTVVRVAAGERLFCGECGADLSTVQTRASAPQLSAENALTGSMQVTDDLLHQPETELKK